MLLKRLKESHLDRNPCENREGKKKNTTVGLQSKPHSSTKSSERLGLLLSALPFSACCFQFPSYLMVQNGCWSPNHHTHIL